MVNRKTAKWIRKAHRYLGIFLGVQFLMWTISGMYFSWTDIDEIHGDQFRQEPVEKAVYTDLISPTNIKDNAITSLELREIAGEPYYWINEAQLYNARTGQKKNGISKEEAQQVASRHMLKDLEIAKIQLVDSVGPHHEYRGRPLPAYEISYDVPQNLKAYVTVENGAFQTVRHRDWRWFDFLWMTHTMDYQGRDDFNTIVLRAFSLLGLITVLSGFILWYASSPSVIKIKRRRNTKKKNKN